MADEVQLDINQAPQQFQSANMGVAKAITEAVAEENDAVTGALAQDIQTKFFNAENGRLGDEDRWLRAYHNYRGQYGKQIKFTEHEKSRMFVKITKTKVLASYGMAVDVVFGGNTFPLSVQPTEVPTGIDKSAHIGGQRQEDTKHPYDVGYEGDGNIMPPGAIQGQEGWLQKEYPDKEFVPGPGLPNEPTVFPAKEAARRMEKLIIDQITESDGGNVLRDCMFEGSLLGTGIIKGPFNYNKPSGVWEEDENGVRAFNADNTVKVPKIESCSVWDFYPDPNARNMSECEWTIQRYKLNKHQLKGLKHRPFFSEDAIRKILQDGPNYTKRSYEDSIDSGTGNTSKDTESTRFEVLEYWGTMDNELLRDNSFPVEDLDDFGETQVNIWVCGGQILRLVANPFKPYRIPYLVFPYERNPYSIFGVGVAENMDDAQQGMNGHVRMAIDNLAISGNVVFDIDESALVPGQDDRIYPGKKFKRQAGMPGQAIYPIKFPNTTVENMSMYDQFRQLADESTGIPSFSHGQTGVNGMTRTASGMSMLMGAASLNIKTVIKNLDDYILQPLGEALYNWNMQFYDGPLNIEGDLDVKATGTSSLIQKEVRSQRLTMFLQTGANPQLAPLIKFPKILRELAFSLDMDPEEILNNQEEAMIYAQTIGAQNMQQPTEPGEIDATGRGDGTIGTGIPAQPGEAQFTGNIEPQVKKTLDK